MKKLLFSLIIILVILITGLILPGCPSGNQEPEETEQDPRTLIVEVEGKDPEVPNCDGAPIIDPPFELITEATQFTYEHGTIVNALILGSTPPPPGNSWQTAIFKYDGEFGVNFSIEMNTDKKIKVFFYTISNPVQR